MHGHELIKKYPTYAYVFNEFDVEKEYIYDSDFHDFVLKNEGGLKLFYKRSLQRGKDVLPTMKNLLLDEGVSDLFIYLSMVESGLSSVAVSPKKAVGLWQFMPKTAKMYNLTVENSYDERKDIESATSAAISYLNKLHRQFGKWYLAAMAYNCGEGCMQHAIKNAGTDELTVILDKNQRYLPKETRDYIKKILLVAMIGENMNLDFGNNSNWLENGFIEVEVSCETSLEEIAKLINIKTVELEKINIKIKKKNNKDKTYKLKIPIKKVFAFYLRYELKEEKKVFKSHHISHLVLLGDTLEYIAKKYNTSKEEIMILNRLNSENLIFNQLLLIPVEEKMFNKMM